MMKTFRKIAAVAVAAVMTLSMAACGGSRSTAADTQDLVVARSLETTDMLPQTGFSNGDIWAIQQVYQTLTRNKTDGSGVEPGLATSWKQSSDGLSWTFKLRHGVKFHNGKTMTAKDVKFSLDFARTARDDKPWQFLFTAIKNVAIVDDYTVRLDLTEPWAPLPSDLSMSASAIMPADFGGKTETQFRNNPVGTGPYKLGEWKKGDYIKFVKNPDYWEKGKPKLNSVTFKYVSDANTRSQMVQSGQAQIDEFPTAVSVSSLKKTKNVHVESFPSTSLIWVNLNNRKKPLNDVHVRRAMAYAIDKTAIVRAIYYGQAESANSMLSKNLMGYSKDVKDLEYSMKKAKEELAKSSAPKHFSLTIQVQSGDPEKSMLAQILQESWKELGIDVQLQTLDSTTVYSNRTAGDFDVAMFEMTNDISDPDEWMQYMFSSTANVNSGYKNEKVDSLIKRAAADSNQANRLKDYAEVQQIIADEAPEIPLVYKPGLFAVRDQVKNFTVTTLGEYKLADTTIAQEQ
ncbi:ABC transporter substrate-binding protein [Bifidobacterium simiarum]|uniref:Solute-binding protein family 5 domain-containing protein n=1 Tax=Bifidobacterium simiarum TaxID=2045441 RepID=A0A2M9HGU0_9BIFI|nr:ABC transporter substrate-binding protein [Bifidobacterium simiarum]PJM75991.1 hypothetical protein CSQ87_00105 [Bifidobacterium simiarum]